MTLNVSKSSCGSLDRAATHLWGIDSFENRAMWFDDFLGDQLKDEWHSGGSGSATVIDAQTGGIVRLTTGALTGNFEYLWWNNFRTLHVLKKLTTEFRLKVPVITDVSVPFQLLFDNSNFIQFDFNTATDTNWQITTVDGGAPTTADSGVAFDTDYHIFRIECFPAGEVHFYIDGVETGNSPITTNIPDDAGDFLQPRFRPLTLEDVAKSMDVDYVAIRQER